MSEMLLQLLDKHFNDKFFYSLDTKLNTVYVTSSRDNSSFHPISLK